MLYPINLMLFFCLVRHLLATFCGSSEVVTSSCPRNHVEMWNTKNVAGQLKAWLQSLRRKKDGIPHPGASDLYLKYDFPLVDEKETAVFRSISTIDCTRGQAFGLSWLAPKLYGHLLFDNGFLYGNLHTDGTFTGNYNNSKMQSYVKLTCCI